MIQQDIYNRARQLERINERIAERIQNAGTKKILMDFESWLISQGLSTARVVMYLDCMEWIALRCNGSSLKKLDEKRTIDLLTNIETQNWEEWTKYGYKTTLRKFFNYLKRDDLLRLVKANPPKKEKLPEDLLSKEDIQKMIGAAGHPRDKALIALLYESGARITEVALLCIKHVTFDDMGAVIVMAKGKTGMRRIRVVYAASYLRQWIDAHPLQNDRDAPLWINLWAKKIYKPLQYLGFRKVLVEAARKAGIKKRVHLHLTRHSRATHLAEHLTEQQMKGYLGWTAGSNMAATYVHLSGKDMDNAVLKMYGMQKAEDTIDPMKPGNCPRCKELNPKNAGFCFKCGLPLNIDNAMKVETENNAKMLQLVDFIRKDPRMLEFLELYKRTTQKP